MAKFADLKRGARQRLRGVAFTSLDGTDCVVDLGLLAGDDDDDVITAADAHCKARQLEPKPGTPGHDFAVSVEKVFRAALDPESPIDKPERYFASADAVRANLDRDRINYLCSAQEVFQNRISPLKKDMSEAEYMATMRRISKTEDGDDRPFLEFSRSMLIDCLRFGVALWGISSTPKSPSGSSGSSESSSAPIAAATSPASSSSAPATAGEPSP